MLFYIFTYWHTGSGKEALSRAKIYKLNFLAIFLASLSASHEMNRRLTQQKCHPYAQFLSFSHCCHI